MKKFIRLGALLLAAMLTLSGCGLMTVEQMYAVGSFASTAASLSTEKSGGIPSIPEEDAVLSAESGRAAAKTV